MEHPNQPLPTPGTQSSRLTNLIFDLITPPPPVTVAALIEFFIYPSTPKVFALHDTINTFSFVQAIHFRKFWTRNKPGDLLEDFHGMVTQNPYETGNVPRQREIQSVQTSVEHDSPSKQHAQKDNQPTAWPLAASVQRGVPSSGSQLPGIGNDEGMSHL